MMKISFSVNNPPIFGDVVADITIDCPLKTATGCNGEVHLSNLVVGRFHISPDRFCALVSDELSRMTLASRPKSMCPECGIVATMPNSITEDIFNQSVAFAAKYLVCEWPDKRMDFYGNIGLAHLLEKDKAEV